MQTSFSDDKYRDHKRERPSSLLDWQASKIENDIEKAKKLREETLRYWKYMMINGENVKYLKALSGQFNSRLELTIYGTR